MNDLATQFPFLTILAQKAGRPISVFDFETTGLLTDEFLGITEIGLLTIYPSGEITRFKSLVNPEYDIPENVTQLTGITNQMVQDAPTFFDLWPQLKETFSEHALFGFNSNKFDIQVLQCQFNRYDIEEPETLRSYDVRVWHQIITQAGLKGKLVDVATHWNVPLPLQLHRAPADVEVTAGIMNNMLEECGFRHLRDGRLRFNGQTPALLPTIQPLQQQAKAALIDARRSAADIFAWISTEMGINGYQPLQEWAGKLNLTPQHLEELLETAIDTKSLNFQDYRHEPTQKWLQDKNRLMRVLSQAYPSANDVGKLHYPHQVLCAQLAKEKPKKVILDFVQLRIAMLDAEQPYVTRRGLLESVFKEAAPTVDENQNDLFTEPPAPKKPRPRFS